ncbi:uncharacterized [Lates japonicus]
MWPNAKETAYCSGLLAGCRSGFDLFLSGLAWHRPQSCPRHNRSYSMRERERDEVGRGGMVPFITMVTNGTINHSTPPPIILPSTLRETKPRSWSAGATWPLVSVSLEHHSHFTVSGSQMCTSAPHSPIVLSFVTAQQTTLLNSFRRSFLQM